MPHRSAQRSQACWKDLKKHLIGVPQSRKLFDFPQAQYCNMQLCMHHIEFLFKTTFEALEMLVAMQDRSRTISCLAEFAQTMQLHSLCDKQRRSYESSVVASLNGEFLVPENIRQEAIMWASLNFMDNSRPRRPLSLVQASRRSPEKPTPAMFILVASFDAGSCNLLSSQQKYSRANFCCGSNRFNDRRRSCLGPGLTRKDV